MINTTIGSFLANRKTAIISLVVLTVLTLYLSTIDSKISTEGSGVFALQTAFSTAQFVSIIQTWGIHGVTLFSRYLIVDMCFALCYSIAFPSVISLMFTQLKRMSETVGREISVSKEKIYSVIIIFPATAAFCNIVSDVLLLKIIHSSVVPSYLISISASFQILKLLFLGISLVYLLGLLFKRRRLYRKIK
jgi:hypothetical protein